MADDDFEVVNVDAPGSKVDFNTAIVIAIMTCNKLLGKINDVPTGLHNMALDLKEDDLKPNRVNYCSAVDAIEITLSHLIDDDKYFKEDYDKIDYEKNEVEVAKEKHKALIRLMARNGLLPLQTM